MKALALALCLAASGCAGTLPVDTLERFAHTLEALRHSYAALCNGREDAAECVHIRGVFNDAVERYTQLNDSLKEQP